MGMPKFFRIDAVRCGDSVPWSCMMLGCTCGMTFLRRLSDGLTNKATFLAVYEEKT